MNDFDWSAEENKCFGCGDNPWGLDLEFEQKGEWLTATTSLHRYYQGFQRNAHGGIIATLLDEASSWAVMSETERLAPSFELNCKFLEPVPLEEEVTARARLVNQRHGIAETKAEVVDQSGNTLAKAKIKCRILGKKIESDREDLVG